MRYVGKKKNKREGGSFLAFGIIVCAVLVYALYTSSAGKWIFKNYIEPVFNGEDEGKTTEQTFNYNGLTFYAMQTGAYEVEENALNAAEEIKKAGGGGYVYYDGLYRVFASFGQEKGEIERVMAPVGFNEFAVAVPELSFKITGKEKNLEAVDNAFKTYLNAIERIKELALLSDKGETDMDTLIKEKDKVKEDLAEAQKAMEKASKKEEKLKALNALYLEIINELNQISESDRTTLSASLKHAYMKMVCEYGNYVKEFTGAER